MMYLSETDYIHNLFDSEYFLKFLNVVLVHNRNKGS